MRGYWFALVTIMIVVGCAAPAGRSPETSNNEQPRAPLRTLVMTNRGEPPSIATKRIAPGGSLTWGTTLRLANAYLTLIDGRGANIPYLAETRPALNTDTWRVFPDGKMETTYRLKPNVTWQDGSPLSAEDFVFAWQVYRTPELGGAADALLKVVDEVAAPDPRTIVIRWNASYPDADALWTDFPPLPKKILETAFKEAAERGSYESFIAHRYWNFEYIGLGPFKLDRWEPGAFMEFSAFDGHVLGRPKIDKIRVQSIDDANVVLAGLLSGDHHLAADDSIRFQQAVILKQEWASRSNQGAVLMTPTQWRYTYVQLRPEFSRPGALLDARVRKALASTLDKDGLSEGLFNGQGVLTDTNVPGTSHVFPALDKAIVKYPLDLRRAEQFMGEAGWTKGSDGIFTHPTQGRFQSEYKVLASVNNETEATILAAGWKRAGFQIAEASYSALQGADGEARATFSGMHTTSGGNLGYGDGINTWHTSNIPQAQNRWRGTNRSGWSSPAYDQLADSFNTTLDRSARDGIIVRLNQMLTEDVPVFSLYFGLGTFAHDGGLKGPAVPVPDTNFAWDIYNWAWK